LQKFGERERERESSKKSLIYYIAS
jgi:hypothetical protein